MSSHISVITVLALVLCVCITVESATFDVTQYGAVGDGWHDDSQAFQRAWNESCAAAPPSTSNSSNTLLIPAGKRFLLETTRFVGPCNSNVHVKLIGDMVAPYWDPYGRHNNLSEWLLFWNAEGLVLEGHGILNGRGSIWWSCGDSCGPKHPNTLAVVACNGIRVGGIKFLDAPGKHFTVYGSRDVWVSNIRIRAPGDSPNTDGFMVAKSTNVTLTNSTISTGDDCVTISNGSKDVNIRRVACGPGHGISIGSLGAKHGLGEVESVSVSDCWIRGGATNGVRIKTWQGGDGYARNIMFRNINMTGVSNPIIVSQFYCPREHCANETSAVKISNISFVGIKGTSLSPVAINLACSDTKPCNNVLLQDVDLKYVAATGSATKSSTAAARSISSYCLNANGHTRGNVSPSVPCLSSD